MGVICALRHIHMSPEEALHFGLRNKDVVRVGDQKYLKGFLSRLSKNSS
jgi:propanediol utilization protein